MTDPTSSAMARQTEREFDLSPSPRILPMLGEIKLEEWQCLAELVDNSIDGFLQALRDGASVETPQIHVHLPTRPDGQPRITVRDNGPGMSPDTLETAVKAGWTSNDPMSNLGLFGMGFNIATARLGLTTRVWSTRAGDGEWHGVEINFQKLIEAKHFRTPMLVRPKADPLAQGTEVSIERLKPDQAAWFARKAHHGYLRNELASVYSAMLRDGGVPIGVELLVNGTAVRGSRHCVWGGPLSPTRTVTHARLGTISAYQTIDHALPERPYCTACWYWMAAGEVTCPSCESGENVVQRNRSVRGWLGIQRYLSSTDYGLDFFRNGRKIERNNKDLFSWSSNSGLEREYPIDDPRNRGRIVGEVHLDHARVYYTKDRFDRNDPAWEDMVRIVRGDGPLRPDKAAALGYGENESPLFRLFQAFRRSTPKPKKAGAYSNLLVVPDNDRAEEMAEYFRKGSAQFQSDEKWYELVKAADTALLSDDDRDTGSDEFWSGDEGGGDGTDDAGDASEDSEEDEVEARRTPLPLLERIYQEELTGLRWDVKAFKAIEEDPALRDPDVPWRLRRTTKGPWEFIVQPDHPIFRSATMTPLDGLMAELAWSAIDFHRSSGEEATFGGVLASLRSRYCTRSELDPVTLNSEAVGLLRSIARSVGRSVDAEGARELFRDLTKEAQQHVLTKLSGAGGLDVASVIDEGRFLEYAPRPAIRLFFEMHPDLFFDGICWDAAYAELDLGDPIATDSARAQMVDRYSSLIADAVWLADHDPTDLERDGRPRLLRAMLSLDLLGADMVEDP